MRNSRLCSTIATGVVALLGCAGVAHAAPDDGPILFTNVHVFDGVSDELIRNASFVVTDNIITAVSTEALAVAGGRVIDGGGRTLMPGLADTHVHLAFASLPMAPLLTGDPGYNIYEAAKKIPELKLTYGTDMFNLPQDVFATQVKQMERLLPWYKPVEVLRMATSTAGELFSMSGLRNPYPDGELGVVKQGAYADLLLVDGNPLEDLGAVTDQANLRIIMKDGKIYKNTL